MRVALLPLKAGDDPAANRPVTLSMPTDAARQGAEFALAPEATNCVPGGRAHQESALLPEARDRPLAALRKLAMTVCCDIRFPAPNCHLAQAGASFPPLPSASFSPVAGAAPGETLLRARAFESGGFVLAPAQTGTRSAGDGRTARTTYGCSIVVVPRREPRIDAGTEPGAPPVEIDPAAAARARGRIRSLSADQPREGP